MVAAIPNLPLSGGLEPKLEFEENAHYFRCRILGGEDPRMCPDNMPLWESIIKAYPLEGGLTLPDVLKRHKEELVATYSLVSQSLRQRRTPFSQGEILEGSLILAREYDVEKEWRFFVRIEEYLAFVTTLRNFLENPDEQVFGKECLSFSSIPWLEEGRDTSNHGLYKLIIDYLGSGNAGVLRSQEGLESYRKVHVVHH